MAKIDKSKYTKAEIKQIRLEKRIRKLAKQNKINDPDQIKNNVLVLKHGSKYSAEYVNKMYKMVARNITLPFTNITAKIHLIILFNIDNYLVNIDKNWLKVK